MRVVVLLCLLLGVARAEEPEDIRLVTGYRDGRPIKLKVTQLGWTEAELATARAFLRMQEAAATDGLELHVWSGFRTHERQAELYAAWRAGHGNPAAKPGFSNHQSGRALDLMVREEALAAWLAQHARRFGFRRTVAGEPWHWEYFAPRRRAAARRGKR